MIQAFLPVLLQAGTLVWGESEFLSNLHKAGSRREADERLEYSSRALRAWKPSDGNTLKADARFRRGEALAELYRFEESESDLSEALELDAGLARAYLLRGRARLRLRRPAEAAEDFKAYTAFKSSDVEGFLGLGEAYRKAGRFQRAQEALLRAERLGPSDVRALLEKGRLWAAQKDWRRALAELDTADSLANHGSPEILAERAACRTELGRTELALADYDKALPLFDRRLEDLQRSGAIAPRLAQAREDAAGAYYGRGRTNELLVKMAAALSDYRQACGLGNKPACAKADALSAKPEAAPAKKPAPRAAPKPAAKPTPKPEKKRLPKIKSAPGERIYGS